MIIRTLSVCMVDGEALAPDTVCEVPEDLGGYLVSRGAAKIENTQRGLRTTDEDGDHGGEPAVQPGDPLAGAVPAKGEGTKVPDHADPQSVTRVKGIGPRTAERLAEHGIPTLAVLAVLSDEECGEYRSVLSSELVEWRDAARQILGA